MTEAELRARFDAPEPLTIGLEEEAMLLDPETFELAPVAALIETSAKRELPAAQLELVTAPHRSVAAAIDELAAGRRELAEAARGIALPACAGTHPNATLEVISDGSRYETIARQYGDVARAQMVCSLQVHVAVGGADRTLAVYNALRGHLPELAALAANAPFHAGRDTGLASVRPLISTLLPRQGVPPAIPSWTAFADTVRWGEAAGVSAGQWWWELRPHSRFGTLELRVPDAQTTLAEAEVVASHAYRLVVELAERYDAGEPLPVPETWRIAENRWAALRDGLDAQLADLVSGERRPVRDVLGVAANGATRQREVGVADAARWLASRYLAIG
jgi:glutamate---cysteine ligase / carboxylate-amine ligase